MLKGVVFKELFQKKCWEMRLSNICKKSKFIKIEPIISKIRYLVVILFCLLSTTGSKSQIVYYVDAASGSDANSGTQSQPFKTITKGLSALGSNIGTVYLRAGTYCVSSKINLSNSGQQDQYIRIWSYSNEKVIIDFTGNTSDGFSISGNFYHLKGLDVRLAGHNGILISGNNNIIENCITRNCSNTGLHLRGSAEPGPSNNLILNCDSFYNFDSPVGGNADGFSAKWIVGSGNIFRGCRAYNNSDDGWDLWMGTGSILIDSCYAFRNGVDIWYTGEFNGNGNGFKLGGNSVATPHTVTNCIAFDNAGNGGKGFDENNNLAGQTLYNCTAFRNERYNYAFNNDPLTTGAHIIKNCISYLPGLPDAIRNATQEKNSWQGFTVTENDFKSIDTTGIAAPRNANGKIPKSDFLRLKSGSSLIDAGVNVGIAFNGYAPDLGAFEYSTSTGLFPPMPDNNSSLTITSFPNPFHERTTLILTLPEDSRINLCIYSKVGKKVYERDYQYISSVQSQFDIATEKWETGLYICYLRSEENMFVYKMIKIK